jgi:hypothetical protein
MSGPDGINGASGINGSSGTSVKSDIGTEGTEGASTTATDAGTRLLVRRGDLHDVHLAADPDAPAALTLAPGEVRLRTECFALTANNITYAAFGEAMKYWQFFPADEGFGCIPVWGFATVVESRCADIAPGLRVYGYLPMGSHLVVQPERVAAHGFIDGSAHRADLARAYNKYDSCDADPLYRADQEGLQALLRPLFVTSFLLDDFLAEQQHFGARLMLLSSASSKTAIGTAFCAARRTDRPAIVGLTSEGNVDFVRSLGCYDSVLTYAEVPAMDATEPTVYVDFAGSAALRRSVHERLGDALRYSCAVGGSHWEQLRSGEELPGPAPQRFFAPAQAQQRAKPAPEGWGRQELQQAIAAAWHAFIEHLGSAEPPWLIVRSEQGAAAVERAYRMLLAGSADPREGLMLSF